MSISSISNVSSTTSSLWESLLKANAKSKSTSSVSTTDSSSNRAVMRDLVDKVSNDTASEDEIQELATKLKEMAVEQANRAENMSLSSGTSSSDTEMKSLMEKIKDGTATSDDIKSIATKMKERAADMQAHFGGMGGPPPAPPNGALNDETKDLIDKVAAGTASDTEIKDLTAKLTEAVNQMQNLTQTTTNSDETSTDSDMASLLEKIKNGTATDADIKSIATQIKGHHHGKPPEGPPPTDDTSTATSATSTATSNASAMEELLKLLSKLSTATSEGSADSASSDSSTQSQYSITASAQLMESFMDAYSQNYNGVITTAQKVLG